METPPLNLCTVLSESKRIINAHSRHFLALSVLFLLPLSFSTTIFPTLHLLLLQSDSNRSQIRSLFSSTRDANTLFLTIVYAVFVFIFTLFAVSSINYSVFHGFYGRPVKLISAIKASFYSFFPLLLTVLVSLIMIALICFVFGLFLFLVTRGFQFFGSQIEYSSPYFAGFCAILLIILLIVLLYLQVNWCLISVIVVVESSWGFRSLRRSTSLMKGLRSVALSLSLFFGFFISILGLISYFSAALLSGGGGHGSHWWKSCTIVIQIVVTSALIMIISLYNLAGITVIYMYCKAVHGELAMEIAHEFAWDYVTLPFDHHKLPHVVSVIAS